MADTDVSSQPSWRDQSTLFDIDAVKWKFSGKKAVRARKIAFLDNFSALGNVLFATRATRIDRTLPYVWMERDEEFKKAFAYAETDYADRLRNEANRLALAGWEKTTVVEEKDETGKVICVKTTKENRRSERMLELLLKAKCPEFREKIEHSGKVDGAGVLVVPAALSVEEWTKAAKEQQRELAERKKSIG